MSVLQNPEEQLIQVYFQPFFSTPVLKWNVQEFKVILVVIDLFGWLWAEFVNADMKGFNLESQAASSYRHFAVLIRPTCNLTAFSPSSNVKLADFTYTVSDSWLTFSALQTGPTTKNQQHFNILKISEMKVGQGSWGFPNYCCCRCRSSMSLMSTIVTYRATKTTSDPHIHDQDRNNVSSTFSRSSCTSSCCVRNPRQAQKWPTVPAGGPWNIPTVAVRSFFPAYLKLNLRNHNLWAWTSNVVSFLRRTRHQRGSIIQSSLLHLQRWKCVATGGVMLPGVLSAWGPVPNTLVTFGATKGEMLPPFPSVAAGKLMAAWTCCLTSLTLTVGAELMSKMHKYTNRTVLVVYVSICCQTHLKKKGQSLLETGFYWHKV